MTDQTTYQHAYTPGERSAVATVAGSTDSDTLAQELCTAYDAVLVTLGDLPDWDDEPNEPTPWQIRDLLAANGVTAPDRPAVLEALDFAYRYDKVIREALDRGVPVHARHDSGNDGGGVTHYLQLVCQIIREEDAAAADLDGIDLTEKEMTAVCDTAIDAQNMRNAIYAKLDKTRDRIRNTPGPIDLTDVRPDVRQFVLRVTKRVDDVQRAFNA